MRRKFTLPVGGCQEHATQAPGGQAEMVRYCERTEEFDFFGHRPVFRCRRDSPMRTEAASGLTALDRLAKLSSAGHLRRRPAPAQKHIRVGFGSRDGPVGLAMRRSLSTQSRMRWEFVR